MNGEFASVQVDGRRSSLIYRVTYLLRSRQHIVLIWPFDMRDERRVRAGQNSHGTVFLVRVGYREPDCHNGNGGQISVAMLPIVKILVPRKKSLRLRSFDIELANPNEHVGPYQGTYNS